jgi:hypothetical protein
MLSSRCLVLVSALLVNGGAWATPATDALGRCLTDSTTGKDRKDLATWIFVAMSTHPELATIAKASPADADAAHRTVGALVTRLLADACPSETRAVVQSEGARGMGAAFEHLGRIAMQELITNEQVAANIGAFERYLDKPRIDRAVSAK